MRGESHIERFISEMELKRYSPQTIRNYKSALTLFLRCFNCPPKSISQDEIKDYLCESSSVSDLKNKISAIKFFYKKVIRQPLKFSRIEYPRSERKLPRIINQQSLVEKINGIANLKHKAILSLAYCCGLRVSEVVNLKIEDINGDERVILISQSKGNKDRYVPVSEAVLATLREYYKQYKPKVYLFNGQFSQRYSITSCQQIFKKYIDQKHSFHHLRHSSFTAMLENGVDLRVIQTVAGHRSPNTTAIYTHVSPKFLALVATPI